MEFYNNRFKEEWERLQVELLRAEVSLAQEKAEAQRICNHRERELYNISKTNVIEK